MRSFCSDGPASSPAWYGFSQKHVFLLALKRRLARTLAATALTAWGAAVGCSRPEVFPKAPVILISIDTLRADHLPVYGYRSVETPNLDRLAADSIVFENAVAQVPLTLPSHVSLFTGLLPFANGVRDNVGYRLEKKHATVATFLRSRGYATGGAVSAFVLERGTGVAEGFDFYEDRIESRDVAEALGRVQRSGGETAKLLEDWISRQNGRTPIFAFLHVYEPHTPYEPPAPFRETYSSRPYDGEIAASDAIVGSFLEFLKARRIYDRAIVILLSDHGEGLGEHGEDEHGILLYREALRVPLFVKLPGSRQAKRRDRSPAGLVDVFPTIAAVLGEKPPEGLGGISLFSSPSTAPRTVSVYSETLYPRFHFGWSDLASLTDARYQYIAAPRPELYDWTSDPAEKRDLAPGLPAAFRSMRSALERMDRPLQSPGTSDPETVRKLASLGYLAGVAPAARTRGLPDPKDRIPALATLKEATHLVEQHRDDDAVALLSKLATENPLMLDVWETLARVLRRAGRPREAIEALQKADRLSPGTSPILIALADLYREAGELDRADSLAKAAIAAGASGVEEELALIALARKDLDEASRQAQIALSRSPNARAPYLLLARIEQARNRPEAALSQLERALEIERRSNGAPMRDVQAVRGDAFARLGREADAEAAFRAEVRNFPENLDAWSRLALLYASAGRPDEFQRTLVEMTQRLSSRRAFETASRLCGIVGDREGQSRWLARAQSGQVRRG